MSHTRHVTDVACSTFHVASRLCMGSIARFAFPLYFFVDLLSVSASAVPVNAVLCCFCSVLFARERESRCACVRALRTNAPSSHCCCSLASFASALLRVPLCLCGVRALPLCIAGLSHLLRALCRCMACCHRRRRRRVSFVCVGSSSGTTPDLALFVTSESSTVLLNPSNE